MARRGWRGSRVTSLACMLSVSVCLRTSRMDRHILIGSWRRCGNCLRRSNARATPPIYYRTLYSSLRHIELTQHEFYLLVILIIFVATCIPYATSTRANTNVFLLAIATEVFVDIFMSFGTRVEQGNHQNSPQGLDEPPRTPK